MKRIGIVGGLGPEATVICARKMHVLLAKVNNEFKVPKHFIIGERNTSVEGTFMRIDSNK